MVSQAIIKRLADVTAEIERAQKPFKVVFITYADPFTKDEITERHYELFPEDRDPTMAFLTVFAPKLSDKPTLPDPSDTSRQTAAWRSLASERGTTE